MDTRNQPLGAKAKVGYLFGDFGCNMSFQLITSYLMLYMTQGMGISTTHWAFIVVIAKVFDAINDPIIGAMVDARKPSKNGKFRPWIFWGGFAIAATTLLLFIDIRWMPYTLRVTYCLVMYMIWSIAYTAANVPYGSLNAVLTDDPAERTSLSSLRSIGAGVATLPIMVILPMVIFGEKDSTGYTPLVPEAFVWVALVCGILGIFGFLMTYFLTTERIKADTKAEKFNYFATLVGFLKNRPALGMCLASAAQLIFVMSYTLTIPLVFQFYFMDTKIISFATLIIMAPMILLIPFMGKLSAKFGKQEVTAWSNLLSIAILIVMLIIPFPRTSSGAWIFAALLGLTMFGGGPFILANWSMVADCIDQQEINTGKREEGSVYATYSFVRKVSQGIGAGLISLCLGWVGYNVDNIQANTQPAISIGIMRLSLIFPLIGYIMVFASLLIIYNLKKMVVEENINFLRHKHQQQDKDIDNP